ncbi:MAG TPA: hypothetical protein DEB39_14850 [Planctomycetaceae bacterium]|nr:hypothetical protein [Planctomycetaceae bacterium]
MKCQIFAKTIQCAGRTDYTASCRDGKHARYTEGCCNFPKSTFEKPAHRKQHCTKGERGVKTGCVYQRLNRLRSILETR